MGDGWGMDGGWMGDGGWGDGDRISNLKEGSRLRTLEGFVVRGWFVGYFMRSFSGFSGCDSYGWVGGGQRQGRSHNTV